MPVKFKRTDYVTAFIMARDGLSDTQIGKNLGVAGKTFREWVTKDTALADAVNRGRRDRKHGDEYTFQEYVFDSLPQHLRELWQEVNLCDTEINGIERLEALFSKHGKRARQHLFLYALTRGNFNTTQALRKVGISAKTFQAWKANEPEFASLLDEIHFYKQNFFEQAFIDRVAIGDTAAVIHAVKTQCRDRGYNEKVEVVHSGAVSTGAVDVLSLNLPIEVRKAILTALREAEAAEAVKGRDDA